MAEYKYHTHKTKYIQLKKQEEQCGSGTNIRTNTQANVVDIHCKNDENKQICLQNIHNMTSMLSSFDGFRAILQGEYMKIISMKKIMKHIFIDTFKFNIDFHDVEIGALQALIDECKKNKEVIRVIFVGLPGHINVNFVYGTDVYIYEPHMIDATDPTELERFPDYDIQKNIYINAKYNVQPLPINRLKQTFLPMCYMYVLHFFYTCMSRNTI